MDLSLNMFDMTHGLESVFALINSPTVLQGMNFHLFAFTVLIIFSLSITIYYID